MLTSLIVAMLIAPSPYALSTPGGQNPPSAPEQVAAEKPWPPPGVFRLSREIVAPRLVKELKPKYTPGAMDAGIAGGIVMEAVIDADGNVGEVRVRRSLDRKFGLDDEAVRTLKQWRFAPGTKDGVAVPVLVEVEMTFSLRKK